MERLTWEYKDGGMFVDGSEVKNFIVDDEAVCTGNAIIRLSKYEDTGLTPEEIQAREEDIKLLQRQNKEFREEIYRLREEVDFWKSNSIQDKSKLGEIRILTKLQGCERCPREDTDCCRECVDPVEDSLRKVLDREAKRIGGKNS